MSDTSMLHRGVRHYGFVVLDTDRRGVATLWSPDFFTAINDAQMLYGPSVTVSLADMRYALWCAALDREAAATHKENQALRDRARMQRRITRIMQTIAFFFPKHRD